MSAYDARLRIEGDEAPPTHVTVDLTGDHLRLLIGGEEIADWAREEMRINALPDGFHIRAQGESIVLDVTEDARFAVDLGLKNAHPRLRQRIAALVRSDG
jgi:hypothetical protein